MSSPGYGKSDSLSAAGRRTFLYCDAKKRPRRDRKRRERVLTSLSLFPISPFLPFPLLISPSPSPSPTPAFQSAYTLFSSAAYIPIRYHLYLPDYPSTPATKPPPTTSTWEPVSIPLHPGNPEDRKRSSLFPLGLLLLLLAARHW